MINLTIKRKRGGNEREKRLCKHLVITAHVCKWCERFGKKQSKAVEIPSLISVGFGSGQRSFPNASNFLHSSLLVSLSNLFLVNSRRVFLVSNYVLLAGARWRRWMQPFLKRTVLPHLVPAWLHPSNDAAVNQLCTSSQPKFSWISTAEHLWKTSFLLPLLHPTIPYFLEKDKQQDWTQGMLAKRGKGIAVLSITDIKV